MGGDHSEKAVDQLADGGFHVDMEIVGGNGANQGVEGVQATG